MLSHLAMIVLTAATVVTSTETLAPAPGPRYPLVSDGRVVARIVLPQKPDMLEAYAAYELQKYVKQITGQSLPIVNESQVPGDFVNVNEPPIPEGYGIWLGQTQAAKSAKFDLSRAKLGRDGYAANADDKGTIIVGRCPIGTLFGVYDLIEREFGVRWIVPSQPYRRITPDRKKVWVRPQPLGEVVPKAKAVSVGTFRREFKPSFEHRWVREGEWALCNRMNVWVQVNGQTVGVNWKWHFHTFGELIPPAKYFKDHPEWFALVKGKRHNYTDPEHLCHDSQLCTTNPEVIEKLVQGLVKTIDADPTIDVITLGANDGGGFCECEKCKALDGPDRGISGRYSDRFMIFYNEVARGVAKHYPDVKIKVGAYGYYLLTPSNKDLRPEPNLLIQICRGSDHAAVNQWAALTDQLGVYQYYANHGSGRHNLLRSEVYVMRDDIPWLRERGVKSFFSQYLQQPWYQCPLNHYIAAKLVWNADLDVDWLIDDYCDKFFEKAAGPMHDYLLGLEKAIQSKTLFDQSTRDKLRASLDKAKQMANSEVVEQRIAAVRLGFDECEKSIPWLVESKKWKKAKDKMKRDIKKLQKQNKLKEMRSLQNKLKKQKEEWLNRGAVLKP